MRPPTWCTHEEKLRRRELQVLLDQSSASHLHFSTSSEFHRLGLILFHKLLAPRWKCLQSPCFPLRFLPARKPYRLCPPITGRVLPRVPALASIPRTSPPTKEPVLTGATRSRPSLLLTLTGHCWQYLDRTAFARLPQGAPLTGNARCFVISDLRRKTLCYRLLVSHIFTNILSMMKSVPSSSNFKRPRYWISSSICSCSNQPCPLWLCVTTSAMASLTSTHS